MYWLPAILILPYFIFLLKLYRSLLTIEPFHDSTKPSTFVSLVIAFRNEENNIPSLLQDISSQNYPHDLLEVILVDDHSTDNSLQIAKGFSCFFNFNFLTSTGSGKKQALRTGILAASGKLIITTDADCRMGSNHIRSIAAFYENNDPDLIICPVKLEPLRGIFGRFQGLEFLSLQGITAGCAQAGLPTMCNGANLAFKRDIYINNTDNLHDEISSGDDVFLLHSLKKVKSSKILWLESPDALISTESSPTLQLFLRQRSRWISKGKAYTDRDTIFLGIITFIAVFLQIVYFAGSLIYPSLFPVFIAIVFLKSIPDFLILLNTCRRYGNRKLMKWFLPVQLLYPFYVISVLLIPILCRWKGFVAPSPLGEGWEGG